MFKPIKSVSKKVVENTPLNLDKNFLFWLAGFSDAEGSFGIRKRKDRRGFSFSFRIRLHSDDIDTLHYICEKLGVGKVYLEKEKFECSYEVYKLLDLKNVIIPVFQYTKLYTNKYSDFLDFCKAIETRGEFNAIVSDQQIEEILKIKSGMNTNRLFDNKSKINSEIPNLHPLWVLGFFEGESSFFLNFSVPVLTVAQKNTSLNCLKGIELFFNNLPNQFNKTINSPKPGASKSILKDKNVLMLTWTNLDSLHDYILPFFQNLNNQGLFISRKKIDFFYWAKVVELRKLGLHLTTEGKDLVSRIELQMNHRRYSSNSNYIKKDFISDSEIKSVLSIRPTPYDVSSGLTHFSLSNVNKNKIKDLIYVYNKDNSIVEGSPFKKSSQVIKNLGVPKTSFFRYLNSNRFYKDKYLFTTTPL